MRVQVNCAVRARMRACVRVGASVCVRFPGGGRAGKEGRGEYVSDERDHPRPLALCDPRQPRLPRWCAIGRRLRESLRVRPCEQLRRRLHRTHNRTGSVACKTHQHDATRLRKRASQETAFVNSGGDSYNRSARSVHRAVPLSTDRNRCALRCSRVRRSHPPQRRALAARADGLCRTARGHSTVDASAGAAHSRLGPLPLTA